MNDFEVNLARLLRRAGIPFVEQVGFGWNPAYCRSKYPCRCGLNRKNDDGWVEDLYDEADADVFLTEECQWSNPGWYDYIVDFLIDEHLIVELDGTQHDESNHVLSDARRDRFFKECGYVIHRLSVGRLMNDPEGALASIQEARVTATQRKASGLPALPVDIAESQRRMVANWKKSLRAH